MDRAKVVSQTITTFNDLRIRAIELFSEKIILQHAEIMIEEYFESQYNPFIRSIQKTILGLTPNDYSVVAIDQWIKALGEQYDEALVGPVDTQYAEVVYIQQKYLPKLVEALQDLKLELLEALFNYDEATSNRNEDNAIIVDDKTLLNSGSIAYLIAQLYNFKVIRQDIPLSSAARVIGPALGCDSKEIEMALNYDRGSHRFTAQASKEELIKLSKVLRSISARVDSQIEAKESE